MIEGRPFRCATHGEGAWTGESFVRASSADAALCGT